MPAMFLLRNSIQHYAWGSRSAIPVMLGQPPASAAEAPWAELWMGAHPSAPSRAVFPSGGETRLDALVAERPDEILGPRVASAFAGRFPFLFKLIAAERPLSIQCHPDAAAARAGFERENRLGVPLDARERSYRDSSHKPELLVALGRFEALVGFRSAREIGERLAAAGAGELAALGAAGRLGELLAALLGLDASRRRALLEGAADRLAGDRSREAFWVLRLMGEYPADPAALAPLFLHLVELSTDQGIYLGAGVLHAYLAGVGLEVMASSDNVLRGGLTDKHIDAGELLAVMRADSAIPDVLEPVASATDPRLYRYRTPAPEFQLGFVELDTGGTYRRRPAGEGGPAIVFSLADGCRLIDEASGDALELPRGASALLTPAVAAYRVEGASGRVYVAEVP